MPGLHNIRDPRNGEWLGGFEETTFHYQGDSVITKMPKWVKTRGEAGEFTTRQVKQMQAKWKILLHCEVIRITVQ